MRNNTSNSGNEYYYNRSLDDYYEAINEEYQYELQAEEESENEYWDEEEIRDDESIESTLNDAYLEQERKMAFCMSNFRTGKCRGGKDCDDCPCK